MENNTSDTRDVWRKQRPELVGDLKNETEEVKLFCKVFGTEWEKTSLDTVWMLGVDGHQFTCMVMSKTQNLSIAYYDYPTLKDFKEGFSDGDSSHKAYYFNHKKDGAEIYPVIDMIEVMKDINEVENLTSIL